MNTLKWLWKWLRENKDWVFGGIGVLVITLIVSGVCRIFGLPQKYEPDIQIPSTQPGPSSIRDDKRLPSLLLHYDHPNLSSLAKEIGEMLTKTQKVQVTIEHPTKIEGRLRDSPVQIVFSYKDATRKPLADELRGIIISRWPDVKLRLDDTIVSEFLISLKYSP